MEQLSLIIIRLVIKLSEFSKMYILYRTNILCFTLLSVPILKAVNLNLLVEDFQMDVSIEQRRHVKKVYPG
ncbi:hypothetical protein PCYB_131220 [Plasmodium cynomolgi strain B]|uniref:Uncharacterized protein n=1 Tax=Plasmodium cynomolgi (strain B) TaxID=1120755 RepID=K6UM31_PLACD|nr:hypothetical protein PCYB_131220 [Plasmodium cynomolgi strain B]GAB68248.1 hypothetical protein PCYB_131220 [Plasmodium cynomolgi strain B]